MSEINHLNARECANYTIANDHSDEDKLLLAKAYLECDPLPKPITIDPTTLQDLIEAKSRLSFMAGIFYTLNNVAKPLEGYGSDTQNINLLERIQTITEDLSNYRPAPEPPCPRG